MANTLIDTFNKMTDPRVDRTKRYPLIEIIFLVISAAISGCDGWKAITVLGAVLMELFWDKKRLMKKVMK